MTQHIVLMGMMGVGKTTVGRELATRLGVRYADNDDALHARTGVDAATYAMQHGVDALHALEHQILHDALAAPGDAVIGAPGSVALDPQASELLKGHDAVWLRARLDTLTQRVARDPARPLLSGDHPAALQALMREREPGFARLATCIVDVDGLGVGDVVDRVLQATGRTPKSPAAPGTIDD